MRVVDNWIAIQNIERYEAQLSDCPDANQRKLLKQLIKIERGNLRHSIEVASAVPERPDLHRAITVNRK